MSKKGRPLGLLNAWLAAGPLCDTCEEYWSPDCVSLDFERRSFFRLELAAVDGADMLFAQKRGWDPETRDTSEPPEQE